METKKNEVTNEVTKEAENEVKSTKLIKLTLKSYSKSLGAQKANLSFKEVYDCVNSEGKDIKKSSAFVFDSGVVAGLANHTEYAAYYKRLNELQKQLLLFSSTITLETVNYNIGTIKFIDYQGIEREITAKNCGTSVRIVDVELLPKKLVKFEEDAEAYLKKQEEQQLQLESEMLLGIKKREE